MFIAPGFNPGEMGMTTSGAASITPAKELKAFAAQQE